MTIMGIDPGLEGGLAWIDDGQCLTIEPMPVLETVKGRQIDEGKLVSLISERRPARAYVELVHAMPKQGVVSMFTFGTGWGIVRGILAGRLIPYVMVRPQEWQKEEMAGQEKGSEALVASRLWPLMDFRKTLKCKKPHEGMVDAALIAHYGWRHGRG
jgi:crossover junction endodeoxyribonuclease RuvC